MSLENKLEYIKSESFKKKVLANTSQYNIEKKIHYNSLINVSEGILNEYESETVMNLKKELCEYISILVELNTPVNHIESNEYYKKYIYPCGYQLERKQKIYSKYKVHLNIYLGITLDILLNILFFKLGFNIIIPLSLVVFSIRGYNKMSKAKKENKYYARGY